MPASPWPRRWRWRLIGSSAVAASRTCALHKHCWRRCGRAHPRARCARCRRLGSGRRCQRPRQRKGSSWPPTLSIRWRSSASAPSRRLLGIARGVTAPSTARGHAGRAPRRAFSLATLSSRRWRTRSSCAPCLAPTRPSARAARGSRRSAKCSKQRSRLRQRAAGSRVRATCRSSRVVTTTKLFGIAADSALWRGQVHWARAEKWVAQGGTIAGLATDLSVRGSMVIVLRMYAAYCCCWWWGVARGALVCAILACVRAGCAGIVRSSRAHRMCARHARPLTMDALDGTGECVYILAEGPWRCIQQSTASHGASGRAHAALRPDKEPGSIASFEPSGFTRQNAVYPLHVASMLHVP
mmetsp:Transcript_21839/g.50217  ORF Transcript_21839/g.50217 Transcript_21839/m.50217 type:complete len:355 (+) Transcript_21839:1043-2107(+)